MNSNSIRWLTLVGLLGFGLVADGYPQTRNTRGAEAATDTLSGTRYTMTSDSDDQDNAKTTYFRFNSNSNAIVSFSLEVRWDSLKVQLTSFDETNFFRNFIEFTDSTVTQGANFIKVSYVLMSPTALGASNDLIQFNWTTPCQADGSNNALTIDPTDQDNVFIVGSTAWAPAAATNGSLSIYTYTGDIWTTNASGAIGTNVKVPLRVENNFNPIGGLYATVTFDTTKLSYQTYDTVGTLSQGQGDITVTRTGGTLTVEDEAAYSQTSSAVWMYLVFRNTMSDTGATTTVTVTQWEQLDDCSLAKAEDTTNQSSSVTTPKYLADLYWQDNFYMLKNSSKWIEVQLLHNFYVDMNQNDNATRAAFRIDADTWTKLKSNQTAVADPVVSGGKTYRWERRTGTDSSIYIYQEKDNVLSDSIPPYATRTMIAKLQLYSENTTGTQAVAFVAEDSAGYGFYEQDSKVTAKSPGYTLHSTTNESDSLFRLHGNTVTITNPGGGGSCPFVYTWTGSEYALEDVVLTESENKPEGTVVSDLLPLTYRPEQVNGLYRIRIHEQEAEKTFLDNVELLTFDLEPGADVAVDQNGKFVIGRHRLMPNSVVDDKGNDVLAMVESPDGDPYFRNEPGWLLATFVTRSGGQYAIAADDEPKPSCKLWAGPTGADVVDPFSVMMSIEDRNGTWHELPKGPVRLPLAHARPIIDLSGYELGPQFRVRYRWDDHVELDEIALVMQSQTGVAKASAPLRSAVHSGDQPTVNALHRPDKHYCELVTGEYVDLEFAASTVPEGRKRSFVLATSGYYLTYYGEAESSRPLHFGLNGNYPNPFNPSTTIRYSLANEAKVTLEVFNVLGQKVRSLISGESQVAGAYEVVWDGKDAQGSQTASGTYLVRFRADDFSETRKMVMLK